MTSDMRVVAAPVGERLRAIRRAQKMGYRILSEKSGISIAHLQRIEKKGVSVGYDSIVALCESMGVPIRYVTDGAIDIEPYLDDLRIQSVLRGVQDTIAEDVSDGA